MIGGASLSGGKATIFGAALGAILLGVALDALARRSRSRQGPRL